MAATTRQLITAAARLISIVQSPEPLTDDFMNIAVAAFDQMIDSWSADRLMVYSIQPYTFATNGGQKTYLLGPGNPILTLGTIVGGSGYVNDSYTSVPLTGGSGTGAVANIVVASGAVTSVTISSVAGSGGFGYKVGDVLSASNTNLGGSGVNFTCQVATIGPGDWNVIRPFKIEQMYVRLSLSPQYVDLPVTKLTDAQYAAIAVKDVPSTFAFNFFDDGYFPLRTIYLWPVPTGTQTMTLWLREPLVDLIDLDAPISYPPGYERAFRFCLAVELAAEFGKTVPPEVLGVALKAKEQLASLNSVPQFMTTDGGVNAQRRSWTYITGGLIPGSRV